VASGSAYITNCIFWGHLDDLVGSLAGIGYCDIKDGDSSGVGGNISSDPLFVNFAGGDYRLNKESPCVNAGKNLSWSASSLDLAGNRRMAVSRVDMGAYEVAGIWGTVLLIQ
jgi:hypothetical protein